ncbi:hypothetical protein LTR70_009559 [Exophiala xenobiotica]|uniref:Uncharacterized protein n=1 Tax=Lithohypha guttulata TaxID=1690604 RepID=A0ABR0JWZ1_9EURO|nr:hypothetical protein LTR24_009447 [Lithohypha guttulata]KAK5310340.1 hypothetical protein LTR70_009559 [Exophiala xenobiotica]
MADANTLLLELCQRATNLASTNSTRTVEYLSVSKGHQTHGFRELAINFLELCQTLWPIQAGLMDASHEERLPTDVAKELTGKVTQTIDDFNSLDLLLSRLLTYERKKGFSKFTKGLGLMNVETEIQKLSSSVAKDRDTLRMGSLAFKWILGDANLPSSMGSAYTSLVTALKGANSLKSPLSAPQTSRQQSVRESSPRAPAPQRIDSLPPPRLAQLPPLPDWHGTQLEASVFQPSTRATHGVPSPLPSPLASPLETVPSATNLTMRQRQYDSLTPNPRMALPISPGSTKRSTTMVREVDDSSSDSCRGTLSSTESQTTAETMLQFEDMLKSYSYDRNDRNVPSPRAHDYDRSRRGPSPMAARNVTRPAPNAGSPTLKAALITAVQQKNHQALEELLDTRVSTDSIAELNLLTQAVVNGDSGSVRLLLISGVDPNRIDKDGLTPLHTATELSLVDVASILLKYGGDPNIVAGPNHESALSMSVTTHNIEFLELFLKHGGNVDALTPDGDTVFIKAMSQTTPVDIVELMLTSGADANRKTKYGKTPLLESLFANRLDIATLLLDHGANPNLAGPKHPLWPATHDPALLQLLLSRGAKSKMAPGIMELATSMNSIEAVQILLKANVDPNIKKDGVYTPLCSAIRDDRGDIVTLLIANGADPNVPASEYPAFKCISHNRLHYLPDLIAAGADLHKPKGILQVAVEHKNKEALLFLLNQGVNPNDRDSDGYTALTTAIRDHQDEMVDILLKHGASPGVRGQDWPITMAVKKPVILRKILTAVPKNHHAKGIVEMAVVANELESIKLLLAAGFSVEDKTGGVFSPLTSALREERTEIVRYLLDEAGADINAPGEHLPIVKALRRCRGSNDTERIEMLLVRGADINLVYRGWNAVMQAIERGDPKILKLMMDKGGKIDLEAKDDSGMTVAEFVRERGWEEGAVMLMGEQI